MQRQLTWQQKVELFRDGYTVMRGAVPMPLVDRAKAAIDGTNATAVKHDEEIEFEQINLNRRAKTASAVGSSPEITDLFNRSALLTTLNSAIGAVAPATGAQIALTFPTQPSRKCMQSGWPEADIPHRGWAGHLDGVWNGGTPAPQYHDDPGFDEHAFVNNAKGVNGCAKCVSTGLNLSNYTCLVGVSLSDQSMPGCGNLGLLKGAHHIMEQFFRVQHQHGGPLGPGGPLWPRFDKNSQNGWGVRHYPDFVRDSFREGAAYTADGKMWPKPTEVLLQPGDAVLALFHVPHNATRNEGAVNGPRYQLYFRVTNARRAQHENQDEGAPNAAQSALMDLWSDWHGLQDDLPRLRKIIKLQEFPICSIQPTSRI